MSLIHSANPHTTNPRGTTTSPTGRVVLDTSYAADAYGTQVREREHTRVTILALVHDDAPGHVHTLTTATFTGACYGPPRTPEEGFRRGVVLQHFTAGGHPAEILLPWPALMALFAAASAWEMDHPRGTQPAHAEPESDPEPESAPESELEPVPAS